LCRMVGETDAEDVLQEVFLKANRALPGFRGDASLATWIYRIATNAALDHLRTSSFRQGSLALAIAADEPGPDNQCAEPMATSSLPDILLIRSDMGVCIRAVVDSLPEPYRTALVLSELNELSNAEIAGVRGVSLGAVKIRIHRARTRLRKELERACNFYHDGRDVLSCVRKPAEQVSPGTRSVSFLPPSSSTELTRGRGPGPPGRRAPWNRGLQGEKVMHATHDVLSVEITGTQKHCPAGDMAGSRYLLEGKTPVLSCEGACIRGEIARLAAHLVAKEEPFRRGCHGELLTVPGSALARWIRTAEQIVLIDGCSLRCHGRVLENLVGKEQLAQFDAYSYYRKYAEFFDIDEVPEAERQETARLVADAVLAELRKPAGRPAKVGAVCRGACASSKPT